MRVNAGPLPDDHWLHDPEDGGGRLLGEGCHFVDLLATWPARPPSSCHAIAVPQPGRPIECSDNLRGDIRFANGRSGSSSTRAAATRGCRRSGSRRSAAAWRPTLDDFRRLELFRGGKQDSAKSAQDKGHKAELKQFLAAVAGEGPPPPVDSYLSSSRATLAIVDALRTGLPVDL